MKLSLRLPPTAYKNLDRFDPITPGVKLLNGPRSREIELLEPIEYHSPPALRDLTGVETWRVPAGFVSDGASIPRIFWRIWSPLIGPWRVPAIFHDFECVEKSLPSVHVHEMFRYCMLSFGTSKASSTALYQAVRWGGPKF